MSTDGHCKREFSQMSCLGEVGKVPRSTFLSVGNVEWMEVTSELSPMLIIVPPNLPMHISAGSKQNRVALFVAFGPAHPKSGTPLLGKTASRADAYLEGQVITGLTLPRRKAIWDSSCGRRSTRSLSGSIECTGAARIPKSHEWNLPATYLVLASA